MPPFPPGALFWKLFGALLLVLMLCLWLTGASVTFSTGAFLMVIAAVLSGLIARSIARPIQRITETAHMTADQLQQRLRELESQRNQAQVILESMVEGVCALDRDGRVLWLNTSAQRLFGVTARQADGKRLLEVFRQPEVGALIHDVLLHHRPAVREVQTFGAQEQTVRLQATPCDGAPADAALVLVVQDVTDIRRLEGVRREFVANVSHELKTPLTSIRGLVETLLNGALEDSANNRRFVTMIDEDATRLTRLIDDLLELSQIESKAAPLSLQPVDVRQLIQDVGARLQRQVQERQVALDVSLPEGLPPITGDPDRVRQIFLNLLDNAVKFNKPGGRVTVTAGRRDASVSISVEDTGSGIPPQGLQRIFERFYRVDKARSRELGGTGLGLAIVKHLVDLHHGTIDVRSQPGRGSTFTVTLPLWQAPSR